MHVQEWMHIDVVCVQDGVNGSQVKAALGSFHLLFLGRVYH